MRSLPYFSALLSLFCCFSCAKPKPEAEYRPTTTIKDLMDGLVDPAADTIWDSVATTMTKKGTQEKAPHTDEEWATVRRSAIQLLEASNLLQIPGRHVAKPGERNNQGIELQPEQIETLINQDRQAWIKLAHGLHNAATLAVSAADAKDPSKVLESGEQIDNACENCHQTYWYPHSTPKDATAASSEVLHTLIGKLVTIRGTFSLRGKFGPYVLLGNQHAIYLVPRGSFTWRESYSAMEGKLVAASGTLSFYRALIAEPASPASARAPDYFYLAAETAQVQLIDR
jgi:hypothetical protein